MKTKKLFMLFSLLAFAFILAGSSQAYAANAWYTCEIEMTGPGYTKNTYIRLTDVNGSFDNKWCLLPPERANEFLATALTALTMGNSLEVYLDAGISYPPIIAMYLYK